MDVLLVYSMPLIERFNMKKSRKGLSFKNDKVIIALIAIALAAIAVIAYFLIGQDGLLTRNYINSTSNGVSSQNQTQVQTHDNIVTPPQNVLESTSNETEKQLLYLIEEEKLAHDVYLAMYEKYGSVIFSNIQKSESRHQESVLQLLESRGLKDPRSSKTGVFTNSDLQSLYNQLISQGNTSLSEAYRVGIIIEETDIADLEKTLASLDNSQTDIKTVLESLLNGSENHLRAFNRKV